MHRSREAPPRARPGTPASRGLLLESGLPHLLDERSEPDFRSVFATLARRSTALGSAVSRIRLGGLDLRPEELRSLNRIRVVVAELNGIVLRAEAEAMLTDPAKGDNLRYLVRLMREGRIEIRSAPLAGWSPDFTVFSRGGRPWTLLVGLHWFARPYPHRGPALASLHGRVAASRTLRRFEELWRRGHDIGSPVLSLLEEAKQRTRAG